MKENHKYTENRTYIKSKLQRKGSEAEEILELDENFLQLIPVICFK